MGVTFYVLIYCLLLLLSTATSWDCRPFEENMPYTLATKWRSTKYDSDKVAWVKNGVIYATCDTDLSCVNYFDHVTEIRTDLNQDGFSWVNLTILNATRREAGVWTLKYIEGIETQASIIEQCNLKSYVKAESVHCNATRTTDGVSVQCVVTRVWPQAVCLFNTSLHDTTIKYVKNETHRHELNALTPVYYNTVCSTKVFDESSFDIDISVFPNFAAGSNDDKYSFRTSFHYSKIDNTFVKVDRTIKGREDNNVILMNETELSDPGQVPNKAEQFKSVTVDLTPSKPERCDQSTDKYSLHIVCAFLLVLSSSFKCQLLIKTDQGYLHFQTEVTSSEQTSFSPDCMFVVPRTSLKPDTYVATVILVEEGKHHPGNNRSITFQIDIEPTLLANGTSKFIQPASLKSFLLFLLAASVVTLAVICLLAYRFRNVLKSERVRLCATRSPSIHSGIYEDIDERLSSLSSSTQAREQAYANTTATRTVLSV
ncbi:hypothetical protein Bpfe_003486 [Biomphalaria pfeifferi]|uniref:Uncharacterized protein n=1 Tax=Biomphalaria pfeifferi TaxID=112525 RepID=A0AAD8C5J3_BIOPF|nr:hypothetical protein Bpfe_003486 [Biomphalaria pfeifferi]